MRHNAIIMQQVSFSLPHQSLGWSHYSAIDGRRVNDSENMSVNSEMGAVTFVKKVAYMTPEQRKYGVKFVPSRLLHWLSALRRDGQLAPTDIN